MPHAAAPTGLRFEHGPVLGIGVSTPRVSWQVPEADADFVQTGYEIAVDGQSFPVTSAEQILVPWPAGSLTSRQRAQVRVRVQGGGDWSPWSEPAVVEAGLLNPSDWTARFVGPQAGDGRGESAPVLTGHAALPGDVVRARLYVTAHGLYRATLNGVRVGDDELAPGWTAYRHRLRYHTYDVTDLVRDGDNRLDVLLGNGWYRGRLGWHGGGALYGDRLAALAQLEVETADGTVHRLVTDDTWTAAGSTIVADDLYDGERTDLRREPGDAGPVDVFDADLGLLVAPDGPPVRVTDVLAPVTVRDGLVDFGQNVVGRVRLTVRGGTAGDEVTVRQAEVLENGALGVRPLRTAKATDTFVLAGPDEVVLEPAFTFHGFRYAEVTGAADFTAEAVVLGSDLRRTGWFDSSHELLNRFHENVVWGMRGNFLDVPTDCPQRDERLGWTGDIQVFSPTATFLYDTGGFLTSWLADLAAEQEKDGSVPFVIPDVLRRPGPATAAWGDAATLVPWTLYERLGDLGLLARQLPSMRGWVDKVAALSGDNLLWTGGFQFGDWLDPTAPPENPFRAKADPDVIATAYFARSALVTSVAAGLVGDKDVAEKYGDLAARVREAFAAEYTTGGGRVLSDAATAYALALQWDLLADAGQREHAAARLADLVRTSGFRISTGFVGTPLMTDALTDGGDPGVAYRLLLQTGCPSWLYAVTMGATTVWERWDSMLPDGSINPGEMTSFNHYALGAVADWMHRRVAGLAPDGPGYRRIRVAPVPDHRLTSASARHLTPYGEASVAWERSGGRLTLRVTLPVGVTATVVVPGGDTVEVGHGAHEWTVDDAYGREAELPVAPTIRQVLDHEPSWQQVVAAAVAAGVAADEADVAGRLGPYLGDPATTFVDAVTHGDFRRGADAFQAALPSQFQS